LNGLLAMKREGAGVAPTTRPVATELWRFGMQAKRRAFKRSGLHRLECESCDGYTYSTVSCLERCGLPSCGCGGRLVPDELELALLLDVDCALVEAYRVECNRVAHGQASHYAKGRTLRSPEDVAAERLECSRRERARSNRLTALLPVAEPLPF
jgi:hypothetical protein